MKALALILSISMILPAAFAEERVVAICDDIQLVQTVGTKTLVGGITHQENIYRFKDPYGSVDAEVVYHLDGSTTIRATRPVQHPGAPPSMTRLFLIWNHNGGLQASLSDFQQTSSSRSCRYARAN